MLLRCCMISEDGDSMRRIYLMRRPVRPLQQDILEDTAFSKEAIGQILAAIGSHREKMEMETDRFAYLLYESDKKSRICWLCEAQDTCYWPETQKNRTVSN